VAAGWSHPGTLQLVEKDPQHGTLIVTGTATEGTLLGESSLFLTPSIRTVSVKAVTDCTLFRCVETQLCSCGEVAGLRESE
jgi:hypothetical protein